MRDDHGPDAAVLRARSAIKALLAFHSAEAMLRALDLELDSRDAPGEAALLAEAGERGPHPADLQDPVYLSRQRARAKLALLRDGVRLNDAPNVAPNVATTAATNLPSNTATNAATP